MNPFWRKGVMCKRVHSSNFHSLLTCCARSHAGHGDPAPHKALSRVGDMGNMSTVCDVLFIMGKIQDALGIFWRGV